MTKDNTFMVKDLLKDLSKELCVVVERNSKEFEKNLKELEVYKKAFEMVCNALDNSGCVVEGDCREDGKCPDCIRDFFLLKAGETDG